MFNSAATTAVDRLVGLSRSFASLGQDAHIRHQHIAACQRCIPIAPEGIVQIAVNVLIEAVFTSATDYSPMK